MKLNAKRGRFIIRTLFVGAMLVLSQNGYAILGESTSTVDQDAAVLAGTHTVKSASLYSIHEIKANNKTVKEYVSASGQVFAISWRGRVAPDLKLLLGTYHHEFSNATPKRIGFTSARANGRAPTMTTTSKMRLFKGGHMGDVVGSAYDPDLLPSGVKAEDLFGGGGQ